MAAHFREAGRSIRSYFIDESGHGGDLASAKSLAFANQPVFALACIGAKDPPSLAAELERLRKVHKCGPGELKSGMARLSPFVSDLLNFLSDHRSPIFVELVDKRFFIAIHIVNHLLCGGMDLDNVDTVSRNAIAEFLTDGPSDEVLLSYIAACRSGSIQSVRATIVLLWSWLDRSDEETARIAQLLTMRARDRASDGGANAEAFLPLFDLTAAGKKVWFLPNLQSLTNIYARINMSRSGSLDGISIIHDEQLQYAKVLEDSKALMEGLAAEGTLPVVPFADYHITGSAKLSFATFREEPCLQAADLIAGCAMRFVRDAMRPKGRVDPVLRQAFFDLLATSDPFRATGVNLVFTYHRLHHMGVPTF